MSTPDSMFWSRKHHRHHRRHLNQQNWLQMKMTMRMHHQLNLHHKHWRTSDEDDDDDENAPSSPTALTSDQDDDENEEEEDHKDIDSDECDRNESTEVEDNSDESNIGYQEQEQVHAQHGLPPDMHTSTPCLPIHQHFSYPVFLHQWLIALQLAGSFLVVQAAWSIPMTWKVYMAMEKHQRTKRVRSEGQKLCY